MEDKRICVIVIICTLSSIILSVEWRKLGFIHKYSDFWEHEIGWHIMTFCFVNAQLSDSAEDKKMTVIEDIKRKLKFVFEFKM